MVDFDYAFIQKLTDYFVEKNDLISIDCLKLQLLQPVFEITNVIPRADLETMNKFFSSFRERDIVLYGCGLTGSDALSIFVKSGANIVGFMDTYKKDSNCMGYPLISLEQYLAHYNEVLIVITSKQYEREISEFLRSNGCLNICDNYSQVVGNMLPIAEAERLFSICGQAYFIPEFLCGDNEVFVDVGCHNGATSIGFVKWCQDSKRSYQAIFAFEPDSDNYKTCQENLESLENIKVFNSACSDHNSVSKFHKDVVPTERRIDADGEIVVECCTLDSVINEEAVTLIKIDTEGHEMSVLKGAKKIITSNKPKLAITVYHNFEDIYEIPKYIWKLVPEYKFCLRHHGRSFHETVLYAYI